MSLGPAVRGKRHGESPRNRGGRDGCIREEVKSWKGIEKDKHPREGRRRAASWTRKKMEREG